MDYQEAKARYEAAEARLGAEFVYGVWHRAPAEQPAINEANGALLAAVEAAEAQMRALEPPDVRAARAARSAEVAARDQRMARGW